MRPHHGPVDDAVMATTTNTDQLSTGASSGRPASLTRLGLFTAAVLGLGWLGPVVDRATGAEVGEGPGQLLWILLPVAAAMVLRWRGDGFADAGLRSDYQANCRWYEMSSAFYPVIMLIAAAGGLAFGHWELHDDSAPLRFAAIALFALIPFTLTAIAEEFGWRGYLTPRLEAAGVGRLTNHVIVGVIWGAWHLPYVQVFWDFSDEPLWTLVPRVLLGTTVAAIVYGEIRLRTGTVWPAVIMHASGNAIAAGLLDEKVLDQVEATPWIFSPGIDGAVVITLTAVVAWRLVVSRPAAATAASGR